MTGPTPSHPGRREANKDAVRAALREAARELFAQHGYEATTVREIASAAGVTTRTFHRYFDGKEGLLAEESLNWIRSLADSIRDRPGDEPPLRAVMEAMRAVIHGTSGGFGPVHLWLFSNQPRPFAVIRRYSPRPFVGLERAIADALRARDAGEPTGDEVGAWPPSDDLESAVLARVAVAALRSAVIHARNLDQSDDDEGDEELARRLDQTLVQTFAIVGRHTAELAESDPPRPQPGRTATRGGPRPARPRRDAR
ncbi:MAG: TetR/AcrR family transcriptional regulator [Solirubrobacteraceae bacterium]